MIKTTEFFSSISYNPIQNKTIMSIIIGRFLVCYWTMLSTVKTISCW